MRRNHRNDKQTTWATLLLSPQTAIEGCEVREGPLGLNKSAGDGGYDGVLRHDKTPGF